MPDPLVDRAQSTIVRAVICTRCWCVVALDRGDGLQRNDDRQPQMCSHLGPYMTVIPDPEADGA